MRQPHFFDSRAATIMTAYVIFIQNKKAAPENHAKYRELAPLAPADGAQFVAKNAEFEILEGGPAESVVILSFPTMEAARKWYHSPEYTAARQHRMIDADYKTVLIEAAVND